MRTSDRLKNVEWWYPISKIMGFRWYMNRIENLLLSICVEHPDEADPWRRKKYKTKDKEVYTRIWQVLAKCEADILTIKKIHKPLPPPNKKKNLPRGSGCYCHEDCGPGWHCDYEDWLCKPGPPPGSDTNIPPARYEG